MPLTFSMWPTSSSLRRNWAWKLVRKVPVNWEEYGGPFSPRKEGRTFSLQDAAESAKAYSQILEEKRSIARFNLCSTPPYPERRWKNARREDVFRLEGEGAMFASSWSVHEGAGQRQKEENRLRVGPFVRLHFLHLFAKCFRGKEKFWDLSLSDTRNCDGKKLKKWRVLRAFLLLLSFRNRRSTGGSNDLLRPFLLRTDNLVPRSNWSSSRFDPLMELSSRENILV